MSNTMSENNTGANDGQQVTSVVDVFEAGREYQRRFDVKATGLGYSLTAAQTEWRSDQEVSAVRWAIGYRTNRLGDYLLKLGDRLCGDKPMGVEELMNLGVQIGNRKGARQAAKA